MKYCKECKVTFNGEKYKQKDAWGNWFYPCPQCREDDNVEDVVEDIKKVKDNNKEASAGNDNNKVVVKVKKKKDKGSVRSAGTPRKELTGRGVSFSRGWPKVDEVKRGWAKTPRCPVCGTCGASWVRRTSQELVCQKCGCVSKGKIIEGEGWRPLGYKE